MERHSAQDHYLSTEVLTATPQKLHLLLVEAAIRSCEQARRQWNEGQAELACEALIHAQDIVTEMLARLNYEGDAEPAKNLASVYLFVLRSLAEANLEHDQGKLDGAIRVLHTERETWQQVCRRFGSTESAGSAAHVSFSSENAGLAAPIFDLPDTSESLGGFSLEA